MGIEEVIRGIKPQRKGRKYKSDPICPVGAICKFGAEKLVPKRHFVCTILTDTDFGERNCPFWKPKHEGEVLEDG